MFEQELKSDSPYFSNSASSSMRRGTRGYLNDHDKPERIGAATLAVLALESVVRHREDLTADVLREVPWEPVGRRIWHAIKAK